MNKRLVDSLLPDAVQVLSDTGIAKDGKIDRAFQGQISSFGAAASTGSLLAAAAFFNKQRGAKVKRDSLVNAINLLLERRKLAQTGETLFDTIRQASSPQKIKEQVLASAVALKLAMNLYDMGNGTEDNREAKPD